MQAKADVKIKINVQPQAVFACLIDLKTHKDWIPALATIWPLIKLKKGSEYVTKRRVMGMNIVAQNRVTKYRAFREIQIENDMGMLEYRVNFKLKPKKDCTYIIGTVEAIGKGKWLNLASIVMKSLIKREIKADLCNLKELLEKRAIV